MADTLNKLQQIKKNYPLYNQLSDQELADKIYDKYYKDKLDKNEYYKRINFSPDSSISKGISGENSSDQDQNSLKSLLSGVVKGIPSSAENLVLGAGDAAQNLMANIMNAIPQAADFTGGNRYNVPLAQTSSGAPYEVGRAAGDIAGFMSGAAPLNEARLAAEAIPGIGKIAEALGGTKALPTTGRLAAGSAIYGGISEPEDRIKGALINGILGGLTGGVSEALTPSKYLASKISPQELMKNLSAAGDTQTNLGRVLENPFLMKQYENIISEIPFSGVSGQYANVSSDLKDKAQGIVNQYLGNTHPEDVNAKILNSLKDASLKQNYVKNSLYNMVDNIAEAKDFKPDISSFRDTANKYKDIIQDQSFLKFEPGAKKTLDKLSLYAKNPEEANAPSLKETNILSSILNDYSKSYRRSPDVDSRHKAKVYKELSTSLKGDVKDSVLKSGDQELVDAFTNAEKNYKENFSPFLDKQIYKFTSGDIDPDTLVQSFIKTGASTDQSNKISKLMNKLPQESQDLVKYAYLSRALNENGDIDPSKLKSLWGSNKLGMNQKKALFPGEEERNTLDEFSRLVKMNPEALNTLHNPKTGARAGSLLPHLILGGIGSYAGGEKSGGEGALLGGLSGLAGASGLSKILSKALTSPSLRNKLVNNIMNPENLNRSEYLTAIANAVSNSLNR